MLPIVQSSPRTGCLPSFHTAYPMPRNAPLWSVKGPQPIHHVTVPMSVEGMPEGWTARVLVLQRPDGSIEVFLPLLKYFKAHQRASSWQDTAAQAIGLLWDYSIVSKDRYPGRKVRDLFRDFAITLAKGTIGTDASDPTGLFWPATPYARCKSLVKAIEAFAGWCNDEDGGSSPIATAIVPLVPQTGEHVAAMLRWSRQRDPRTPCGGGGEGAFRSAAAASCRRGDASCARAVAARVREALQADDAPGCRHRARRS